MTVGKITSKLPARRDRNSLQEVFSEKCVLRIWVKCQNSNREFAPILISGRLEAYNFTKNELLQMFVKLLWWVNFTGRGRSDNVKRNKIKRNKNVQCFKNV